MSDHREDGMDDLGLALVIVLLVSLGLLTMAIFTTLDYFGWI